MEPVEVLRAVITDIPPPWRITLWTVPADGRNPTQYSAGYFSVVATAADIPDDGLITFYNDHGCAFVIAPRAIGEMEKCEDGGVRFKYINLNVAAADFLHDTMITITKDIVDDGGEL